MALLLSTALKPAAFQARHSMVYVVNFWIPSAMITVELLLTAAWDRPDGDVLMSSQVAVLDAVLHPNMAAGCEPGAATATTTTIMR